MVDNSNAFDLEFILIGMKFDVKFEEGLFSEDEQAKIRNFIDVMSHRICVDKSYVDCKGNYRKSKFMLEEGWNKFCDAIFDTRFCQYMYNYSEEDIASTFATIGRCYMYESLAKEVENISSIDITLKDDCEFDVIICKDTARDWKNYIGPWQNWEFDENGNFLSSNIDDGNDDEVNNNDD